MHQKFSTHYPDNYGNGTALLTQYFAPGRVNLIGEHIDYNGGAVLPFAISRGIYAAVQFIEGGDSIEIRSQQFSTQASDTILFKRDERGYFSCNSNFSGSHHWAIYVAGVIDLLQKTYSLPLPAAKILFDSDLPIRSGLSSSAAIEVLTAFLFAHHNKHNLANDKPALALFCQRVENEFVGVQCGIMDQFAVAAGKEQHAIRLNCHTLAYQYVPLNISTDHHILVMNTNKDRALIESRYNERRQECSEALQQLQKTRDITHLCEATPEQLPLAIADPLLLRRARHVVSEMQRVTDTVTALQSQNWAKVGRLLNESHHSLCHDYEVTGIELDTLTALARTQAGCLGARMTGAGFGGCAIAIVESKQIQPFSDYVMAEYTRKIGLPLDILDVNACEGVRMM